MRLLIDTHIAVWWVDGSTALSQSARSSINLADGVFVSATTIWEIAIKFALRKGRRQDMTISAYDAIEQFEKAGFAILSLEPLHVAAVGALPPIHRDPFDRLLIAHAAVENMNLMTHDATLAAYGDFVIVV